MLREIHACLSFGLHLSVCFPCEKRKGMHAPEQRTGIFVPRGTPPPCISYALVQATVGAGTVIIVYLI